MYSAALLSSIPKLYTVLQLRNLIFPLQYYVWPRLCSGMCQGGRKVEGKPSGANMLLLQVHSSQSHDKKFSQPAVSSVSTKDTANKLLIMNHHKA